MMPKVPSILPQDLSQKWQDQPSPSDFLMAAADMHSSGALAESPRSNPMPKDTRAPASPRSPRKLKVLK